jgi:hypothetical protein
MPLGVWCYVPVLFKDAACCITSQKYGYWPVLFGCNALNYWQPPFSLVIKQIGQLNDSYLLGIPMTVVHATIPRDSETSRGSPSSTCQLSLPDCLLLDRPVTRHASRLRKPTDRAPPECALPLQRNDALRPRPLAYLCCCCRPRSRFTPLFGGARPRCAPILARAAHSFHPLPQEPGYSVKTSLLTPAGPLPERVAARSGAITCGTHTAIAACSTEHGRPARRHKHEG